LERSNADLQQFAYAIAHDLQEPLRNVVTYSELVSRDAKLEARSAAMLTKTFESAVRMQTMVRDLLTYSTAITVPSRPPQTVDCNGIVQVVIANLKVQIEESNAAVTCEELPSVCMLDSQLMQLFQNLISNALKYHRAEAPRIDIAASEMEGEWAFSVRDNGIGIKAEYRDRIFGLFRRLHGSEIPGTGLGLAICKRIVEQYGGRIWVESEYGRGSTFCFSLPESIVVAKSRPQPEKKERRPHEKDGSAVGRPVGNELVRRAGISGGRSTK